jgi:hypothetical protein
VSRADEDRLWAHLLGELDAEATARLQAELAGSAALRETLESLRGLAELMPAAAPPLPAPASVRDRLLAATASGAERWAPFVAELSRAFQLGRDAMRAVLERAQRLSEWEPGPIPGSDLFHFDGGPALAGVDCGLVRYPAGFEHPLHVHDGDELTFVLSGGLTDSSGRVLGPGDALQMPAGSQHAYRVHDGAPLVFAIRLEEGITVYPGGLEGPSMPMRGPKGAARANASGDDPSAEG